MGMASWRETRAEGQAGRSAEKEQPRLPHRNGCWSSGGPARVPRLLLPCWIVTELCSVLVGAAVALIYQPVQCRVSVWILHGWSNMSG